jgi:tRNA modification GTPase
MSLNDTIVALATPPGQSALAVIRFSGPKCKEIYKLCTSKEVSETKAMRLVSWKNPINQQLQDSLLAVFFEGPNSFTGQDIIEIFPHGNPLVIKNILTSVTQLDDVRLAEPGEFTRRAFELGRIDLVQAESIAQLIHATDQKSIDNAQRLLRGELSGTIFKVIEEIKFLAARMELDVDFVEEEADPQIETWVRDLETLENELEKLANSFALQKHRNQRKLVVLAGSPNAGKSSLINALVKEDRLIVSSMAGTTRDYIEVPLLLPGGEVHLVDTAGLGEAIDDIDAQSQQKTKEILQKAAFVVELRDGTQKKHQKACENPDLLAYSKADLEGFDKNNEGIFLSAHSGENLNQLKMLIDEKVFGTEDSDLWLITERQEEAINNALAQILKMKSLLVSDSMAIEILAFEMQEARVMLQEITGEISSDAILNRLFAGFCIGK